MTCPYCKSEHQPGAVRCPACTSWIGAVAGFAATACRRLAVVVAAMRRAR